MFDTTDCKYKKIIVFDVFHQRPVRALQKLCYSALEVRYTTSSG